MSRRKKHFSEGKYTEGKFSQRESRRDEIFSERRQKTRRGDIESDLVKKKLRIIDKDIQYRVYLYYLSMLDRAKNYPGMAPLPLLTLEEIRHSTMEIRIRRAEIPEPTVVFRQKQEFSKAPSTVFPSLPQEYTTSHPAPDVCHASQASSSKRASQYEHCESFQQPVYYIPPPPPPPNGSMWVPMFAPPPEYSGSGIAGHHNTPQGSHISNEEKEDTVTTPPLPPRDEPSEAEDVKEEEEEQVHYITPSDSDEDEKPKKKRRRFRSIATALWERVHQHKKKIHEEEVKVSDDDAQNECDVSSNANSDVDASSQLKESVTMIVKEVSFEK